jgi:hypothetical protein
MTTSAQPTSTPAPDDKRVFLLLRKTGLDEDEAYTLVQEIQNMAAANLIARFESKLDAQNAKIDSLRWVLGAGLAALGLLVAALRLFS